MNVIIRLDDLFVQVHTLRLKTHVERRIEIVKAGDEDPLISLTAADARALSYMLRRHATEASRP